MTRGIGKSRIARRFHSTLVEMVAHVCDRLRAQTGLNRVVLSGGVFMNAILSTETPARLAAEGFDVFCHQQVPANDGGISLGQLAVAAAVLGKPARDNNNRVATAAHAAPTPCVT